MIEMILMIAVLAVAIMSWSKISKAMDWTGRMVGQTADPIEDLLTAGGQQTARAVAISNDSLLETLAENKKKAAKRETESKKFLAGLDAEQKKAVEIVDKRFEKYLNRI